MNITMKNITLKTRYIKNFTASLLISVAFMFSFVAPLAHAGLFDGAKNDACGAVGATKPVGTGSTKAEVCDEDKLQKGATSLSTTLNNIIDVISILVGIAAVIMLIISGFRYITSGGDSGKVGEAKQTIIYAIVGLIIVALAQFIVKFVLEKAA